MPHLLLLIFSKFCNNRSLRQVMLLALLILLIQWNLNGTAATNIAFPLSAVECGSMDIRNDCSSLLLLRNCTVIKGFLIIVLLRKFNSLTRDNCKFDEYKFPLLREVTDYMLLYDIKGMVNIGTMFPNLTVIRGRQLFLNYALGISNMPHLEEIELRNLIAIQRGHVFIGSCPKLCKVDEINWERLTISTGENHIYEPTSAICDSKTHNCIGCPSGYCWSNKVCQKFDNDNVLFLMQGFHNCQPQCLGGCNNNTIQGCVVCRTLTDHGACVGQCPMDKYLYEPHQRCYTRNECVNELDFYTNSTNCVERCPNGFISDDNDNCVPCTKPDDCFQLCQFATVITIYNLADADLLRSCETLNGTLFISISSKVDENDLTRSLANLKEIRGYLKISKTTLTSLKFLSGLQKIHGETLESDTYSFILYDNPNLTELWPTFNLEFVRGGIYAHLNNKLCNSKLRSFRNSIVHDKSLDSLQTNDQEVLCDPAKLPLQVQAISRHTLIFYWPMEHTSEEIEILFRPIPHDSKFEDHSELDSNICTRINWQRNLIFRSTLSHNNGTHYIYTVDALDPYTRYACLVKTFGEDDTKNARSEVIVVTTHPDIPTPAKIEIIKKSDSSFHFKLIPQNQTFEKVDYYKLELYDIADDKGLLDKRNYCTHPVFIIQDMALDREQNIERNEDYDECCAKIEEKNENEKFLENLHIEFGCSLDRKENCMIIEDVESVERERPAQSMRLYPNASSYDLYDLKRYHPYVIQVQACNEIGCGSYIIHPERTNYSIVGDNLEDLHACLFPITNEYHVYFNEPKQPNGLIVSYVIHFRVYKPGSDTYRSHINCITRLQHELNNYHFVAHLNTTFNEVAVRIHSLAGDILTHWVNVSNCNNANIHPEVPIMTKTNTFAEHHSHGLNVFLVFFLIGAGGTLIWIFYKRRLWRKIPEIRRYLPLNSNLRNMILRRDYSTSDDRQILVENFDTVRFHNNSDDDQKYLE